MAEFSKTYRKYFIQVSRDRKSEDWYIIVQAPSGSYLYDGWWPESAYKPKEEAFQEALYGSCLKKRPKSADELESLLSAASGEKGVG